MWVSHFFPALNGEHRLAFMVLAEGPFVPIIFPLLAQSGKESMTGGWGMNCKCVCERLWQQLREDRKNIQQGSCQNSDVSIIYNFSKQIINNRITSCSSLHSKWIGKLTCAFFICSWCLNIVFYSLWQEMSILLENVTKNTLKQPVWASQNTGQMYTQSKMCYILVNPHLVYYSESNIILFRG